MRLRRRDTERRPVDELKVRRALRALEAGYPEEFERLADERGLSVEELLAVCDGYLDRRAAG